MPLVKQIQKLCCICVLFHEPVDIQVVLCSSIYINCISVQNHMSQLLQPFDTIKTVVNQSVICQF